MGNLAGHTILLTGASGGIGSAMAQELSRQQATVMLVGRAAESLESTRQRITAVGGNAITVVADLLNPADRERLAVMASELPSGLQGLVHCAGINEFALLEGQGESAIEAQLSVNLLAPVLLTRAVLPALHKAGNATVLFVGSTFGTIGYPGYTVYCASKAGLRGFSEALRRELADSPICILYFAPRATRTAINPPQVEAMNQALGNAMDLPEAVAQAAVKHYLAGKPAQCYFGWPEKLFARINQIMPAIVDNAIGKQLAIIKQYASRQGKGS